MNAFPAKKSYIATVGGIITVSMTWMTPLLHSISVNVMVAFSI